MDRRALEMWCLGLLRSGGPAMNDFPRAIRLCEQQAAIDLDPTWYLAALKYLRATQAACD